jgi:anti-sigma regulatory factor (Ser/Thr protein kinase)
MMTTASLRHPTMRAKLREAYRNVGLRGYATDHVTNRKGQTVLAVRIIGDRFEIRDRDYRSGPVDSGPGSHSVTS